MLIKKIRLVNFKNFEDVTVELNDFNVLVGANASGKTNFIQAMRFFRSLFKDGLENAIQLQSGMTYFRNTIMGDGKNTIIEFTFGETDYEATINNLGKKIFGYKSKITHSKFIILH